MKQTIRLTENDLHKLISNILMETIKKEKNRRPADKNNIDGKKRKMEPNKKSKPKGNLRYTGVDDYAEDEMMMNESNYFPSEHHSMEEVIEKWGKAAEIMGCEQMLSAIESALDIDAKAWLLEVLDQDYELNLFDENETDDDVV